MSKSDVFIESTALPWQELGNGVRRKMMGFDDSLMMVCVEFDQGAVGYLHTHPHRQATFVTKGTFEVQIGKEKRTLHAGDSYFTPPEIEHGVVALEAGMLIDVFTPARQDLLPGRD